jgi:hypothetical protein
VKFKTKLLQGKTKNVVGIVVPDAVVNERDFEPEALEKRCGAFFETPPAGWASAHLLFSSGQAALSTLLWTMTANACGKLRVSHLGSYFETRELCARACAPEHKVELAPCVIVEPVACDGAFSTCNAAEIAKGLRQEGQTLIVDETLTTPLSMLPTILATVPRSLTVARLVSGLKLFQQGLELANVGILSVYAADEARVQLLAGDLRRMRTLTGAGLRFVDALALEAPFFLDRQATAEYAARLFDHNARLARRAANSNAIFAPIAHPSFDGGAAPYCTFQLREGGGRTLTKLTDAMIACAEQRELVFERGGSFGFRGHRFELIEPETGEQPYLRVAMGARAGWSCDGVIELMADIAVGRML